MSPENSNMASNFYIEFEESVLDCTCTMDLDNNKIVRNETLTDGKQMIYVGRFCFTKQWHDSLLTKKKWLELRT